ncbi:MAG: ATP-binding protein [Planctomycetota bacterium]
MNNPTIDQLWLLMCSGLVLLMQAGFLCLEAGLTRSKNSVNVAFKNMADLAIAPLMFWLFGAQLMFGVGAIAWTGDPESGLIIPLIFQTMFCATAATIVSGAVAERMRLNAYAVVAGVICLAIYPIVGSWAWGGAYGGPAGWLESLGFKDFAGSGVVHMTGGFAALAVVMVLGPRTGRFAPGRLRAGFPKANLPLAMLGAIILFFGWIGFNGGSTGAMNDTVGVAVLNTMLCAVSGCTAIYVVATLKAQIKGSHCLSPEVVINGLLGALVASCAAADVMQPIEAILTGVFAALAVWLTEHALVRLRIDDVVGAFPVHGVGGLVGIVAAACVANSEATLGVQVLGAAAIGGGVFLAVYLPLRLLAPTTWLRVSREDESRGLNEVEHGVKSEFQVLSQGLETVAHGGAGAAEAVCTSATPQTIIEASHVLPTDPTETDSKPADDAEAFLQQCTALLDQASHDAADAARDQANQRTEGERRAHGELLHAIFDALDTQIAILDAGGVIIECNHAWRQFVRHAEVDFENEQRPTFYGVVDHGVYRGNDAEALSEAVRSIVAGQDVYHDAEHSVYLDGHFRDFHVRVKPLPTSANGAAIVVQCDVSDVRTNERALVESKEQAETLANALETSQKAVELAVNGGNLGLWYWDVNTGYFELNRDWLVALGHENADLGADIDSFRDLLHSDDRVLWTSADAASLAVEEPYDRQFRLRRADGTYAWTQALGRANARRGDGAPEALSGIFLDIDARKNAELRDTGMAKIIEESVNEVFVVDATTWRFIEVNRGARENLGLTLKELIKLTPADINPEYDLEQLCKLVGPLRSGDTHRLEFETRHERKDGTAYPVMINLQASRLVGRDVFVAIAVDLTQRRKLEAQLANAQKLESIGQLAAGVAHEMNTPLQYVGNNIAYLSDCSARLFEVIDHYERLLSGAEPPSPWPKRIAEAKQLRDDRRFDRLRAEIPQALDESTEGVQRVLKIVRAMKEFSHPGETTKTSTDLNKLITSMTTVTRNRWKYAAELDLQLDAGLPTVACDAGAINQVVVNLIVNAADAIAGGEETADPETLGKITVRTSADDEYATVEVTDTGCGMEPELLDRIFDPFFTTKQVGKGTGQGLSLSHTIVVENHGGCLEVESEPGVGSCFRVRLPLSSHPADAARTDATEAVTA